MSANERLWRAARKLADEVDALRPFDDPVSHVYNPLGYAARNHREYLLRYANTSTRQLYLGMNPGPWGMAQTGIPFGHVGLVCSWLGISNRVGVPEDVHPKYPVLGFACHRSEGSGARLWGLAAERHGTAERFFRARFVANYCPLLFIAHDRNLIPEKLSAKDRDRLFTACDRHLQAVYDALEPDWVIGVGRFARKRAESALAGRQVDVIEISHPSPASPAANRGWAALVDAQLARHGLVF